MSVPARHAVRRPQPTLVTVSPYLGALGLAVLVAVLLLEGGVQHWAVAIIGGGTWGVAWCSDRAGGRLAAAVLLGGCATVCVIVVVLGGSGRDLVVGAWVAASIAATARLCGALDEVEHPPVDGTAGRREGAPHDNNRRPS